MHSTSNASSLELEFQRTVPVVYVWFISANVYTDETVSMAFQQVYFTITKNFNWFNS